MDGPCLMMDSVMNGWTIAYWLMHCLMDEWMEYNMCNGGLFNKRMDGQLNFEWIRHSLDYIYFQGSLCGTCGNGTTITILRFLCKENCEEQQYTIYYSTIILS